MLPNCLPNMSNKGHHRTCNTNTRCFRDTSKDMNIHLHLNTLEQHGAMDHKSHVYSTASYKKAREAE